LCSKYKATKDLKNCGLFKNQADPDILIDQLTNEIWVKTYKQLLVDWCKIEQSTDQNYLAELNVRYTEEERIWITKILDSSGKEWIVLLEL
jgi:hypothetical protein